jgi:4-amino-4-deoxy-L-arabinose transferase-like glycosyltransferase
MNEKSSPAGPSAQAATWMLLAALVVGAALRIYQADAQLWYDEITTLVHSVRAPLSTIATHFPSNNDHVLYSVLANLSISALGDHPWTVRLPAILLGIASIPLLFVFGKQVTTRFEAAAAALLMALSYHHVWYSQNARGYTALLCVSVLSTHLLVVGLRENRRWPFVAFGLVAALGAYTHLTMVLAVLGQAAVVAVYLLGRRRGFVLSEWINPAIGFATAALATVALYAPLLGDVQAFFSDGSQGVKAASAGWALLELLRGLQVGFASGAVLLVVGTVFVVGCGSYLRQNPLALGLFLFPPIFVFASAALLHRPTFPRFFFFVAGFALLIAVRGALTITHWGAGFLGPRMRSWRPQLAILAVIAMVAVSAAILPRNYAGPKQDFAGALRFLGTRARAGDLIVTAGGGATYVYDAYYGRPWRRVEGVEDLSAARRAHPTVWVVRTFDRYVRKDERPLFDVLETTCRTTKFPGTLSDGDVYVSQCRGVA